MNTLTALQNLKSKGLGLLIFFILFLALNYHDQTLFFSESEKKEITLSEAFLKGEFPEMKSRRESDELPGWTVVLDARGEEAAYFTVAQKNSRHSSGYAGPVPLFIKLTKDKTIQEVELLENRETGRFIARLEALDFMNSWTGMTLREAAEVKVDAVTGVTLTSRTIIDNMDEALADIPVSPSVHKTDFSKLIMTLTEITLLIFALFSFFLKDMKKYRIPFLVTLILVYGFSAGKFISLAMLRGFLTGSVPFRGNPLLWLIFILSMILPLFSNKAFYCSQVCPFGALQELTGRLTSRKKRLPRSVGKAMRGTRPVLFGLLALMMILDYPVDLSLTEPFAAFLFSVAAPLTLILALLSLVLSLFYSKPWCRWFCPTGQFLEYLRSDQ